MAMVGDVAGVVPSAERKPLWLIPNLLSLDAPLVAIAWLYMFAKTWRADYLPWATYISLALVVWVIYVTDRLLDASSIGRTDEGLRTRHEFHRRHRRVFAVLAAIATVSALVLVVTGLATRIFGFALIGGSMVAGFFVLAIFSNPGPNEIPYSKNIVAGMAFAYGTAMLPYAYTGFEMRDFIFSSELICFAVLCILNISAIDFWEHSRRFADPEVKATDELALTLPLTLLGAAALVFAVRDHELSTRPFFYAILTGAALLQILNRTRARFSPEALRVLADVALLLPLLVFKAASAS